MIEPQDAKSKWDILTSEDILADPSSIPYNDTINDVLMPWEPILKQFLDAPDTVDADEVPAEAWLEETVKNKINKELVPYVGSLSLTIRAQIANWFDVKIGRDKKKQRQWLGRLPIAHAYTIYIAMNLKADRGNKTLTDAELFEKAWKAQFSGTPSSFSRTACISWRKKCLSGRLMQESPVIASGG